MDHSLSGGEGDVQSVLHQALGALLAGQQDLLALGLGQAVSGVRLDGGAGIVAGRGGEGGGGAEGGEGSRWTRCGEELAVSGLSSELDEGWLMSPSEKEDGQTQKTHLVGPARRLSSQTTASWDVCVCVSVCWGVGRSGEVRVGKTCRER